MRPGAQFEVECAQIRSFLGDLGCVEAHLGCLGVLFKEGGGAGPGAAEVGNFRNFSNVAKSHEMMGDAQKYALK